MCPWFEFKKCPTENLCFKSPACGVWSWLAKEGPGGRPLKVIAALSPAPTPLPLLPGQSVLHDLPWGEAQKCLLTPVQTSTS